MPIEFRCLQCQHPQTVDESQIGQQVYCRVCYYKLTVPAESTVKPIEEIQPSELYALDTAPLDVQKMQERREELISFPCNLCQTLIGVRKEQVGEELLCPECGQKITVPKLVATLAEARLQDKRKKASALLSRKEIYSLRSETSVPANEPTSGGSKQFRVPCRLCETAMFATKEQVGTFLTCPDCETKTEVPPPPDNIEPLPLPPLSFEGGTTYNIATPSSSGERLVPVVCSFCGTRMSAAESQIGQFKTCPDCGRQTEIKAVPKPRKPKTSTTRADAYKLGNVDEAVPRPPFRMLFRSDAEWHAELALRAKGRPPLPKRPLTERFFVPFGYPGTWLPLILLVPVIPLGMMIIHWAASATEGANRVGTFGYAIFTLCFGSITCFAFVAAFCYFASFALHLYDMTCGGMDEVEYRGEVAPFDYFINGFWLVFFSFAAILPGCFIGNFLYQLLGAPFVLYVMIRVSHAFFFPIFFLSSIEAGSMFAVFAKNILVSLFRQPFAWFRFYLLTGILFVLSDGCFIPIAAWLAPSEAGFLVLTTLFVFLFAIQSLFFFRLLGRLAWLIEETARQKRELEEE